ncbi:GLI pathogenesis-related 2, like isoform X8 [Syngnathus typhle]|uniref:GLI pathogenesis-related 2, like isoform X8 n=1 Tax=Syngnathus typhle TaxID=161592 RepID=UPI002A6B68E4|nr:GLI pathogenesis-related 2, like isoform X8 [Syngnathus typhle]
MSLSMRGQAVGVFSQATKDTLKADVHNLTNSHVKLCTVYRKVFQPDQQLEGKFAYQQNLRRTDIRLKAWLDLKLEAAAFWNICIRNSCIKAAAQKNSFSPVGSLFVDQLNISCVGKMGKSGLMSDIPCCLSLMCLSASKQFAEEVLQCHNDYRKKHQAPALKLSSKLSREAARKGRGRPLVQ